MHTATELFYITWVIFQFDAAQCIFESCGLTKDVPSILSPSFIVVTFALFKSQVSYFSKQN